MRIISAYFFGLLFAIGLAISGMTDPRRVIAFLEIGPHWSENLLFVMGGALTVTLIMFPKILKRKRPVLDNTFHFQNYAAIDRRLILGALFFGSGWGLSGYCPGPLVVGLASLNMTPWLCFFTFLMGLWIARRA